MARRPTLEGLRQTDDGWEVTVDGETTQLPSLSSTKARTTILERLRKVVGRAQWREFIREQTTPT